MFRRQATLSSPGGLSACLQVARGLFRFDPQQHPDKLGCPALTHRPALDMAVGPFARSGGSGAGCSGNEFTPLLMRKLLAKKPRRGGAKFRSLLAQVGNASTPPIILGRLAEWSLYRTAQCAYFSALDAGAGRERRRWARSG